MMRLQMRDVELDDAWWHEHRSILWSYDAVQRLFKLLDEESEQKRDGAAKQQPQQQMAYGFRVVP